MTLARRFHPEAGRILEWPRIAPVFPGWHRELVVRTQAVPRLPYRVLYYFADQVVVILAVAHYRRKPGYWRPRLGEWGPANTQQNHT
ncbi:hypothetical protein GCM10009693_07950 [Leucobacter chromiireducens subsp. chromiireducens]|uniref:Type II toxin-antitoxin system RelE/ParE family toxin n=1 Tax=Leucobacter chromiireducens subsp. chromiireducens TaxID=660067 RepID=A0ABS1SNG0_9MICO|nr:hypothetical protein [Leucobacter chromiireducens subsp. chromiireducens]